MHRTAQSHPLLFRIASWLFIASVTCDGTNVDDLCSGCIIVHDDELVIAASRIPADETTELHSNLQIELQGPATIRQIVSPPMVSLRIILDQDSPSLHSGGSLSLAGVPTLFIQSTPLILLQILPAEPLHIRFHTLLI